MKKLLAAAVLIFASLTAHSRENVTIIYSWVASDAAANFYRNLAEEANRIQNQYRFAVDTRPGAGGSIAANYVLNNSNTILATASAFYIRPNFFPTESYDLNAFRSLMPQCAAPALISSSKYKTWKEVPRDQPLTIGVSGMGTTTHVIATQVAKQFPLMTVIPFKGTADSLAAVLGGNLDFSVNFLGDSMQYAQPNSPRRVYMLGITGEKTVAGVAPLISQGFPKTLAGMNIPAQLVVPKTVPEQKFQDWRRILVQAGRAQSVLDSYRVDFCESNNQMSDTDIVIFYRTQVENWRKLTQGISLQ